MCTTELLESNSYLCKRTKVFVFKSNLHKCMIDGGFLARRPFKEVVELGLKLPVLDIPPRGSVVEGLAQKADPVVREPAARASISCSTVLAVV